MTYPFQDAWPHSRGRVRRRRAPGSVHLARLGAPDVPRVIGDGPVAREAPRRRDVEHGLAGPVLLVRIQLAQPRVRLAVAPEVGKVQVMVAPADEDFEYGPEHAGLVPAEVVTGNEVEG